MHLKSLLLVPAAATLLLASQSSRRSTADGVYTAKQAAEGRDLWAASCQSCHGPHQGPPFKNKWMGRDLAQLFIYTRNEMPKSDPGSLSDEEYATTIAYLLRVNGMPAGESALPADSAALLRIRFDSVRTAPTTTGPRR